MAAAERPLPPYISYRTFINYLAHLGGHGVPAVIDRSVLEHMSGTIQSQLLLALRFLDLVDETNRPRASLHELVEAEGPDRRKQLRALMLNAYTFLAKEKLDLASATSEQLERFFAQAGTSGETLRRSLSFFVAMAKEAGFTVSPYVRPHRGKNRRRRASPQTAQSPAQAAPATSDRGGNQLEHSVALSGGATLTLCLTGNVFVLEKQDRDLVFELVDRLRRYQETGSA